MITKFICSFCNEVKTEIWILGEFTEDRKNYEKYRCNECRERSKRDDSVTNPSCCGRDMEPCFSSGSKDGWFCRNCTNWVKRCGALNTDESQ